jgi:hypothetical protein
MDIKMQMDNRIALPTLEYICVCSTTHVHDQKKTQNIAILQKSKQSKNIP